MIKAVIFDLDDTLISERKYIESGYWHISKIISTRYRIKKEYIYQQLISLFRESSKCVFNRLFENLNIPYSKSDILELVYEYRNHFPNVDFFGDVLPCLMSLKEKEIKLGIITDGYANGQRQKLKKLKANDYFDEIIVTDELGREFWKPHPKSFELMKDSLRVEYNEMVYIGDNPKKDFFISEKYPIKAVRISRENGIYGEFMNPSEIELFLEIKSLKDFPNHIFS